MNYQYENLDPERFQQFSQALLVKENPGVQCFPVAQPDGGRDAIIYYPDTATDTFIVYQIKFVRNPYAETNPHKWLSQILEDEAPKVTQLIPKGAVRYYLITNIPGTAHPEVGSIDKVQKILTEAISIPAMCWWRDDLNRRLDSAWELKWVYPELMTGLDMLHYVIESRLSDEGERRTAAIKAFLRDQYDTDQEVRFKQIQLQNLLLDLFIDVPIALRQSTSDDKHRHLFYQVAHSVARQIAKSDEGVAIDPDDLFSERVVRSYYSKDEENYIGAASMLLHPLVQKHIPQIVLEGAPGQGKSTITQYICQVHRMRILGEESDLRAIAKHHRSTPVRLPFRVDLRDLATWLSKQNPFSAEEDEGIPEGWYKSLEAFLAAQVKFHSGGIEFSTTDLSAVAKLSDILLVLDGLDEVADIPKRREIVNEVTAGIRRLRENAVSLQVVITSRPAAFANSPGFSEKSFPHYELTSITRKLIDEYANRWIKARRIHQRDGSMLKRTLKDKLNQPHFRDLARNPMQLAILLSLIDTKGSSLPEQRTALYDYYVDLFFNRESEKSVTVREHRRLLIDIHRYLAWLLHSEAEQGRSRGSIASDRLHTILTEYLRDKGRDVALADKLFAGMVERVVALVSRVQGTYEFEVQPLREFFAARYLYDTAPYSPAGVRKKGTLPDRFDAIARDFYWLNVTRFYAGCYSTGELPSLVERLQELVRADGYRNISHPRVLAAMLLADWVFEQNHKAMQQVVKLVLDGLGLRYALSSKMQRNPARSAIILPKECGRDELVEQCFVLLRQNPAHDYALEVIDLIKENTTANESKPIWLREALNVEGDERTKWIGYGLNLGLLPELHHNDLESLLSDDGVNPERLSVIFRARQINFIEGSEERSDIVTQSILDRGIRVYPQQRIPSVLAQFSQALDASAYRLAFQVPQPMPLTEAWQHYPIYPNFDSSPEVINQRALNAVLDKCSEVIHVAHEQQKRSAKEWATDLTPWDMIIEKSRAIWGEKWAHFHLANVASGIKNTNEKCADFVDLLDHSRSLSRRVRYARLRARTVNWWRNQLEIATTENDIMLTLLVMLTWCYSPTLTTLAEILDPLIANMTAENWMRVIRSVQQANTVGPGMIENGSLSLDVRLLPDKLSERTATAFAIRAKQEGAIQLYQKYLADYRGTDPIVLEFCQQAALNLVVGEPTRWRKTLNLIRESYARGIVSDQYAFHGFARSTDTASLPVEVAEEVVSNPDKYPRFLVFLAEARCRDDVASKIIPVGAVANSEDWFID